MQGYSLCVLRMSCVLDTIAGWGSWSDEGLKPMKDLVTYQFRTECLRKDDKNEHVTMNKHQDKKIAKHLVCVGSVTAATHYCFICIQVSTVPWPYTGLQQFEKTHSAPLGRHWNTEATFHRLVKPQVVNISGMDHTINKILAQICIYR